MSIDLRIQQVMFAGQARDRCVGPVEAGVIDAGAGFRQPGAACASDLAPLADSALSEHTPLSGKLDAVAETCRVWTEEDAVPRYHLEAIVIAGIMAASYLNSALHIFS